MWGAELELGVRGDRAVLTREDGHETDPRAMQLSDELTDALHEWARVSVLVGSGAADADGLEVVARRGRQLARRVATTLGVAVRVHDPVEGRTFVLSPPSVDPHQSAVDAGEVTAGGVGAGARPVAGAGGMPGAGGSGPGAGAGRVPSGAPGRPRHAAPRRLAGPAYWHARAAREPGPTPWGTGLLVAGFFAAMIIVAMLALAGALASATHGIVAIGAGLIVTAGLAPSLWLGRQVPVVRWIVGGTTAGIALSWVGVLIIAL
ncbi:DUF2537 domain-containing protein [Saccharomonospora sp. CUA-673]|uniref:DUF2537 domain-containing protein n=1 Tax=Saccharomonospora sp. CUA-673 TaxID=1904969 RepID=UPI000A7D6026|nr:DUF2537 domain-containing protein [Saccharomonospora sp. CUA-673]